MCSANWANGSYLAGVAGFEPTRCQSQSLMPYRLAIPLRKIWGELWDSNPWPPESQSGTLTSWAKPTRMACLKGFEPPTNGLEGRCSILLSYRHRQCVVWSGWWESDPRSQLGRLVFYHWTTPALQQPLHYISVAKNCQRFEIFFCDFFREVSYFWQQVTNFATTFVVIRLLKASTFKNLRALL